MLIFLFLYMLILIETQELGDFYYIPSERASDKEAAALARRKISQT